MNAYNLKNPMNLAYFLALDLHSCDRLNIDNRTFQTLRKEFNIEKGESVEKLFEKLRSNPEKAQDIYLNQ